MGDHRTRTLAKWGDASTRLLGRVVMSKGRMEDLLEALRNDGWRLLSEREHPNASSDPFKLEDDIVRWAISRADNPSVVELEFHAFADLGQRTGLLRDILYCQVVGRDEKLYFAKREKPEWRQNLAKFVQYLKDATVH